MSDINWWQTTLAAVGEGQEGAEVQIRVRSGVAHINLRGNPDDSNFLNACSRALGQPLPIAANTFTDSDSRAYWLGPDEWHIVTTTPASERVGALEANLDNISAACNDVSGGYVCLELTGAGAADVLAKGCTLDLHPRVFKPGSCAQTNLAKCAVLIARSSQENTFDLLVRRSFAEYACLWLARASSERGWFLTRD